MCLYETLDDDSIQIHVKKTEVFNDPCIAKDLLVFSCWLWTPPLITDEGSCMSVKTSSKQIYIQWTTFNFDGSFYLDEFEPSQHAQPENI